VVGGESSGRSRRYPEELDEVLDLLCLQPDIGPLAQRPTYPECGA
jgi:hypothetical protein